MKILVALASVYFIFTFIWERKIFHFPIGENLVTYIFCKIIQLIIIIGIVYLMRKLIKDKNKFRNIIKDICKYSFPYLLFLIVVTLYQFYSKSLPYLSGDEWNILFNALEYDNSSYMFTYLTGYYYIISISLIPTIYAPVIIKLFFQAFVLGYIMMRLKRIWNSKYIYLLYVLFLLQPVLMELGPSAHRLPIYGMMYIVVIVKLFCDYKENRKISKGQMLFMMLTFAILMQWRVEGIYLLVFAPLLLILAYQIFNWKKIIQVLVVFGGITVLVALPQQIETKDNYVNERMSHFYNYVFVNMCRNGLNQQKYQNELEIIDHYLSIDAVNKINKELGDLNYTDELIAWDEDYVGIRENYTPEQYRAYTKAVLKIIIENPLLYIQSQGKAWNYISAFKDGAFETRQTGILKIVKYLLVIERFLARQLYIPTMVIIAAAIYSLFKKRWLELATTVAIFGHSCIVFLLMPAAYFKYYYIVYLGGYFILLWHILEGRSKKYERQDIDFCSNV